MADLDLTDAVEAAADALRRQSRDDGWTLNTGHDWDHERAVARAAVEAAAPLIAAAAEQRGRESVGLGDFLPDPCGDEERAPEQLDYAWLRCTRTRGHDGEHENRETGLTWAAEPAASPAPTEGADRG